MKQTHKERGREGKRARENALKQHPSLINIMRILFSTEKPRNCIKLSYETSYFSIYNQYFSTCTEKD